MKKVLLLSLFFAVGSAVALQRRARCAGEGHGRKSQLKGRTQASPCGEYPLHVRRRGRRRDGKPDRNGWRAICLDEAKRQRRACSSK